MEKTPRKILPDVVKDNVIMLKTLIAAAFLKLFLTGADPKKVAEEFHMACLENGIRPEEADRIAAELNGEPISQQRDSTHQRIKHVGGTKHITS